MNSPRGGSDDNDEEYSLLLTRVAEKVMELSMAFITQCFPEGDDLHSPLVHFADVMGISNRTGRFNEAYNYTSYIASLMWMIRLLTMEYALPSSEYIILNWSSHEVYVNKSECLKQIHDISLLLRVKYFLNASTVYFLSESDQNVLAFKKLIRIFFL